MNDEKGSPKLPEIGTPILTPGKKEVPEDTKTLNIDEEKRSQAIRIITSLQNSVVERQKSLNKELQRVNKDLQKTTDELAQKQQILASIYENINTLLKQLSASQEEVQTLRQLIEALTSSDPSVVNPIIQKVVEYYEADRRSNINNSVNKIFEYNKYN